MRNNLNISVLGTVYIVSVAVAALDAVKHVKLGWVTTLAWWVVVVGALGFILWVVVKVYHAFRGGAPA